MSQLYVSPFFLKPGVRGIKIENGELPCCFGVEKCSRLCSLGTAVPGISCATHVSAARGLWTQFTHAVLFILKFNKLLFYIYKKQKYY